MAGIGPPDAKAEARCCYLPSAQEALGFATIAEFMCSDSDRVVFRRFQKLNLYNLMFLQHQILRLDQQVSYLENIFDGDGLAELLPRLNPLLKTYSKSPVKANWIGPD